MGVVFVATPWITTVCACIAVERSPDRPTVRPHFRRAKGDYYNPFSLFRRCFPLACALEFRGYPYASNPRSPMRIPHSYAFLVPVILFPTLVATNAKAQTAAALEAARNAMVNKEIVGAGVKNPRVIEAMRTTPRHEFVPLAKRRYAYLDMALPIGNGQTISPPFIVAYMTEALDPKPTDRVLEIGNRKRIPGGRLAQPRPRRLHDRNRRAAGKKAAKVFEKLKYDNVHAKVGDGFQGWPEHAPFDKIIVTCSPERVPVPLFQQLREGGRMVIPVGERYQQTLYLLTKKNGKLETEKTRGDPVRPHDRHRRGSAPRQTRSTQSANRQRRIRRAGRKDGRTCSGGITSGSLKSPPKGTFPAARTTSPSPITTRAAVARPSKASPSTAAR